MSLRILQLNSLLTGGGTDDQCIKLSSGLHQLEQRVLLFGPGDRELSDTARETGVPFKAAPSPGTLKIGFIRAAAGLIWRERIQIVHGHHGRDLWPTVLAARWSGLRVKVVLTRHLAKSPSSWMSRRLLPGRCDALVAVSDFVAKVLREGVYEPESPEQERRSRPPLLSGFDRIHVVRGGIDTGKFKPFDAETQRRDWGLKPEDYAFAVAGGFNLPRGKGQREFLQAAAKIHQQVPNARFLIIGRGNMEETLKAEIERLGLKEKAWLTGQSSDMPQAMNAIDCLVHPQVGTEAFGLVLLEAFACGRPVIASALDGIPEAFGVAKFGQLVKPESIEELAAAMKDWAQMPRASAEERKSLHAKVDAEYSVLAFGRRMLKLYERLAGNS
jgi:glycosyltransferase involved in cell wall biosynthesis